jgi:hypothetical protein
VRDRSDSHLRLPVDLRGQPATSACSSTGWIDHVETRSPPYVCSV